MQEGHTTLAGQRANGSVTLPFNAHRADASNIRSLKKAPTSIPQTGHHVELDLMVVGKQLLAGGIAGAVVCPVTVPIKCMNTLLLK